jgi:hypothetical protein
MRTLTLAAPQIAFQMGVRQLPFMRLGLFCKLAAGFVSLPDESCRFLH